MLFRSVSQSRYELSKGLAEEKKPDVKEAVNKTADNPKVMKNERKPKPGGKSQERVDQAAKTSPKRRGNAQQRPPQPPSANKLDRRNLAVQRMDYMGPKLEVSNSNPKDPLLERSQVRDLAHAWVRPILPRLKDFRDSRADTKNLDAVLFGTASRRGVLPREVSVKLEGQWYRLRLDERVSTPYQVPVVNAISRELFKTQEQKDECVSKLLSRAANPPSKYRVEQGKKLQNHTAWNSKEFRTVRSEK